MVVKKTNFILFVCIRMFQAVVIRLKRSVCVLWFSNVIKLNRFSITIAWKLPSVPTIVSNYIIQISGSKSSVFLFHFVPRSYCALLTGGCDLLYLYLQKIHIFRSVLLTMFFAPASDEWIEKMTCHKYYLLCLLIYNIVLCLL